MCDDAREDQGRRARRRVLAVPRRRLEEIIRQSQDVATRLERAADRLEDAVDRVDRRHRDRTEDTP